MKLIRPALAVSLVLQTTLARFLVRGSIGVDLVLVAVTYLGLTSGPVVGLFAGTIGGLTQDALSTGIVGIGGLAKTIVGFIAGIIGTHFIVSGPIPRFVVFLVKQEGAPPVLPKGTLIRENINAAIILPT